MNTPRSWFNRNNSHYVRNVVVTIVLVLVIAALCLTGVAIKINAAAPVAPVASNPTATIAPPMPVELQPLPIDAPAIENMIGCGEVGTEGKWGEDKAPFTGTVLRCGDDKVWVITHLFYNGNEYQIPKPVAVPEPTKTSEPAPSVPIVECSLTDGVVQIQVEKVGNEYVVDPNSLKVVKGYNNTQIGHDVSKLSGCDMWAEYELDHEHIITVLRDDPAKSLTYLSADGKFHIPSPMGGSFWVGPAAWNTADMSTQKPSIALEMAAEKDVNQLRNGYDWPEQINLPDGSRVTFEVGHQYGAFYSGCKDLKQSPAPINVAGTIVGDQYSASIGIEGCTVAVKINGSWTFWDNARDNVLYSGEVEAWLFKEGTTNKEVQDWIASH